MAAASRRSGKQTPTDFDAVEFLSQTSNTGSGIEWNGRLNDADVESSGYLGTTAPTCGDAEASV